MLIRVGAPKGQRQSNRDGHSGDQPHGSQTVGNKKGELENIRDTIKGANCGTGTVAEKLRRKVDPYGRKEMRKVGSGKAIFG